MSSRSTAAGMRLLIQEMRHGNHSSCSQQTRFYDTCALTVHRAGVAFNRAPKPQAIPGVSFISSRSSLAGRRLRAAAGTHPAVIWQSHLLDVTPQQWNSLKVTRTMLGMHILDILQAKTAPCGAPAQYGLTKLSQLQGKTY